jgi:hypothetical protein
MHKYTELSLTVPITNSLAFLFTVLGEWWVENKVISRGKENESLSFSSFSLTFPSGFSNYQFSDG